MLILVTSSCRIKTIALVWKYIVTHRNVVTPVFWQNIWQLQYSLKLQPGSEKDQYLEKYYFVIQTNDIFGLGINYRIEWYNILPLNMRFSSGPK